jgi:hypothetical protein
MNLGDRKADAFIQRWLEMLQGMQWGQFKAGDALKRHFYQEWLKPKIMPTFFPPATYLKRTTAATLIYDAPLFSPDVLLLRAGKAEREQFNFDGVTDHLDGLSMATASPSSYTVRQIQGWRRILALQRRHRRTVRDMMHTFRRCDGIAASLRQEFDLPPQFASWFWLELERAVWRFVGAKALLSETQPHVLVSAGDHQPIGYVFHIAARELGIPALVIQHGFIGQAWLHYPLLGDKVCVWGEVEKQWYVERGVPALRIAVTGNPRGITDLPLDQRESIRRRLGCSPERRLAIWFTTPQNGNWMERFFQWVHALNGMDAQLILKLHPKETPADYQGFIPSHISIFSPQDLDLKSAYTAADVVIHDHSSIGAEADRCGQNVICAAVDPPYPDYYHPLVSFQHRVDSPSEMAALISQLPPPALGIRESLGLRYGGQDASHAIAQEIRALV